MRTISCKLRAFLASDTHEESKPGLRAGGWRAGPQVCVALLVPGGAHLADGEPLGRKREALPLLQHLHSRSGRIQRADVVKPFKCVSLSSAFRSLFEESHEPRGPAGQCPTHQARERRRQLGAQGDASLPFILEVVELRLSWWWLGVQQEQRV